MRTTSTTGTTTRETRTTRKTRTAGKTRTTGARRSRTALMTGTAALAVAGALLLSGCGSSSGSSANANVAAVSADTPQKPGTLLDTPFTKPNLVLTDNQGKPYDLVKQTAGHPTLLFFGYTH